METCNHKAERLHQLNERNCVVIEDLPCCIYEGFSNKAMSYAVMQKGTEPPTPEQLSSAFQAVPGLTAMDVTILGKDAYGVLVNGLELERASAMQSALASQGVEAEVVDEAALTELPAARQLTNVEFTPEALRIGDLMGHNLAVEWKDIEVIAAGRARLSEFTTGLVNKVVLTGTREPSIKVALASVNKEEKKDHLLLEIITRGAALRFHAVADRPEAQLLFRCLGDRRSKDAAANLLHFVQDVAKFAPEAALNHGAFYMRENGDASFSYPSKTAFYREITWLLWMVSAGRGQAGL